MTPPITTAELPQRYDLMQAYDHGDMVPTPDGDWVRWEDVDRLLTAARQQPPAHEQGGEEVDDDDDETIHHCPFCGGTASYGNSDDGGRFIECGACHASTALMFPLMDSVDDLLREKWNARPDLAALSRPTQGGGGKDWPDTGENANYQNRCTLCRSVFHGHKRRVVCYECFSAQAASRGGEVGG
jgi:hypothetical protein